MSNTGWLSTDPTTLFTTDYLCLSYLMSLIMMIEHTQVADQSKLYNWSAFHILLSVWWRSILVLSYN